MSVRTLSLRRLCAECDIGSTRGVPACACTGEVASIVYLVLRKPGVQWPDFADTS